MVDKDNLDPVLIIDALAMGVHPFTGEPLPAGHVMHRPPVIRALFAVLRCIDVEATQEDNSKENGRYPRGGEPWTKEEETQLANEFERKMKTTEIANLHGRTSGAITSRLARLGLVEPVDYQVKDDPE